MLSTDDYMQFPAIPGDRRLAYAPGSGRFGDLYLPRQAAGLPPDAGPHPVAIVLHGGCWQARYGLAPLGRMCAALAAEGLAVWNVEYRRLDNGGGWPLTFMDVATAADCLRRMAPIYNLDLARVISIGHSAGGHLALWLAGRKHLTASSLLYRPAPLPIHGVLSLAGVPDLAAALKEGLCGDAAAQLAGGLPSDVPAHYQQASPVEMLPLGVRQWHIIGRDDDTVHVGYLQRYAAVAAQHDLLQLDILPDAGHFEVVDPRAPAWAAVRHAALALSGM